MAKAARPDTLSNEEEALASILPVVSGYLGSTQDCESRHNLRLTSSAVRKALDLSAAKLTLGSLKSFEHFQKSGESWQLPSLQKVKSRVQAAVARGCKPTGTALVLPADQDTSSREQLARAFLPLVNANNSVTRISLFGFASLTPSIASAICDMEHLKQLGLSAITHPDPSRRYDPAVLDDWAQGVELLLRKLGPRLDVCVAVLDGYWQPHSLRALVHCTALTTLCLSFGLAAARDDPDATLQDELEVMPAILSLTHLRRLDLFNGAAPPTDLQQRIARAGPALSGFSALTALTRLGLGVLSLDHYPKQGIRHLDEAAWRVQQEGQREEAALLYAAAGAEWSCLLGAVKSLPSLAALLTGARVPASDLAELTRLTWLRVGKLVLPPGDEGPGDGRPFAVPPRLRRLDTHVPVSPRVLARLAVPSTPPPTEVLGAIAVMHKDEALRLPVPPKLGLLLGGRLWKRREAPWCLAFEDRDLNAERDALLPEAVVAVQQALSVLLHHFDFLEPLEEGESERGLCVTVWSTTDNYVGPPPLPPPGREGGGAADDAAAAQRESTHCESWLGSLAAVRPGYLEVQGLFLPPRDMAGLAESMSGLKVLRIYDCGYSVSSLALLAGMQHLEELRVFQRDWSSDDETDATVETAFLALTAVRPSDNLPPWGRRAPGDHISSTPSSPEVVPVALPALRLIEIRCAKRADDEGDEEDEEESEDGNGVEQWLTRLMVRPRRQLRRRGGGAELRIVREE